MKYKVDFISVFPKSFIKKSKPLEKDLKKLSKELIKESGLNYLWSYGERDGFKNNPLFYICFSQDDTMANQMYFYMSGYPRTINNKIHAILKKHKLSK